ncbi:MAG TPA: class I SAM-dependent methyltransferase [bacterium]|nr:class I SAM-dependent methyltransferase [bacterium]
MNVQTLLADFARAWLAPLDALPLGALTQPTAVAAPEEGPLAALYAQRDALPHLLTDEVARAAAINAFTARARRYLRLRNQYLLFAPAQLHALHLLHAQTLNALANALFNAPTVAAAAAETQRLLGEYRAALAAFVGSLVETNGSAAFVYSEPVCSRYTPELQLRKLGVTVEELAAPVLDLGCGESAALVHHLRARGLDAQGVDLEVEPNEFLHRADWFSFELGEKRWGAIVSHQGFTLHFQHHHLRRNGHPERYAQRFLEILRALAPGGRFLYAPRVPFFEEVLAKHQE